MRYPPAPRPDPIARRAKARLTDPMGAWAQRKADFPRRWWQSSRRSPGKTPEQAQSPRQAPCYRILRSIICSLSGISRSPDPVRPVVKTMGPCVFGQFVFRNSRSEQYGYHQQRDGGRKDPPCHYQQEFDDHIHVSLPPGSHMQRLRPRPASICKGTIGGGGTNGSDEGPTFFQRLRPEPASN